MIKHHWHLLVLIAFVLAIPFALKPAIEPRSTSERTLVIISPHNRAVRHEFDVAFRHYWLTKTGEKIYIDWRSPGGTSEIARYLAGEFSGAFERYWKSTLKKKWTPEVMRSFDNPKVLVTKSSEIESEEEKARRLFLESDVGIGIDLFFGGGSFDFSRQAEAGRLVDSGIVQENPEWFGIGGIPQKVGGEEFWDKQGRWIGTCLGGFGICYNRDSYQRLKIHQFPQHWSDLAIPELLGQLALTDPTRSGSAAKAYEMVIQEQMRLAGSPDKGWANAMVLLRKIAGNARYFSDAGSKPAIDVSLGDAAAGMVIDFYGRFQAEAVSGPEGNSRVSYVTPKGGSSIGCDPIGLLRGAKQPELAKEFIRFVLSDSGQKLWNYRVGTPGGPERYALRRMPIVPKFYSSEHTVFRSDLSINAYDEAHSFEYKAEWTAPLFHVIRFAVRVTCIDSASELREAWRALIQHGFPPKALAEFESTDGFEYADAQGRIREALRSSDRLEEVRLTRELVEFHRAKYRRVTQLAKERK